MSYTTHTATAPFQRHSMTSFDAAKAIEPKAGTLRAKLLEQVRRYNYGLTDQQMQMAAGMDPNTQRPRRIELLKAGLIKDSGRTRKTASGRNRTDVIRELLAKWSAEKLHESTLICRVSGCNPFAPEVDRK